MIGLSLNCWFVRRIMVAVLAIFMLILQEKFYCIDPQHGRLIDVTSLQTKIGAFYKPL